MIMTGQAQAPPTPRHSSSPMCAPYHRDVRCAGGIYIDVQSYPRSARSTSQTRRWTRFHHPNNYNLAAPATSSWSGVLSMAGPVTSSATTLPI